MAPTIEEINKNLGAMAKVPERMYLADVKTGTTIKAQFNPDGFEETLKVAWARLEAPGLSHRSLQYTGTENVEFGFDLIFDAQVRGSSIEEILRARRFLKSFCYAKRGATNVREGQASRVLFVWPNFLSLTCVINELSFKYETFLWSGEPLRYTVKVKLEEIRDIRIYSEDERGAD